MLIIQAIIVSIIGGIIFSIIGIIPGTDETATMAPITLILVLMDLNRLLFLHGLLQFWLQCRLHIQYRQQWRLFRVPPWQCRW